MHVVFVEPAFPANQRQFVRGLHAAGARVTGIGEAPLEALDDELQHWLFHYEQVRLGGGRAGDARRRAPDPGARAGWTGSRPRSRPTS